MVYALNGLSYLFQCLQAGVVNLPYSSKIGPSGWWLIDTHYHRGIHKLIGLLEERQISSLCSAKPIEAPSAAGSLACSIQEVVKAEFV
jgi:hypothetical protein